MVRLAKIAHPESDAVHALTAALLPAGCPSASIGTVPPGTTSAPSRPLCNGSPRGSPWGDGESSSESDAPAPPSAPDSGLRLRALPRALRVTPVLRAPECALKGLMLSRHSPGGVVRVAIGTVVVTAVAVAAVAVRAVSAAKLCRVIKHSGCSTSRAVTPASEPLREQASAQAEYAWTADCVKRCNDHSTSICDLRQ
eukprot:21020-Heterococcus_DN1.PRE.1